MSSRQAQAEFPVYVTPKRQSWLRRFSTAATSKDWAVMIIGPIYALSPIDVIPEVVLGPLGLLDDAGVALVVIRTIYAVAARCRTSLADRDEVSDLR